jgi:hypothetical protein
LTKTSSEIHDHSLSYVTSNTLPGLDKGVIGITRVQVQFNIETCKGDDGAETVNVLVYGRLSLVLGCALEEQNTFIPLIFWHKHDTELILKFLPRLMTTVAMIDFVGHILVSVSGSTAFGEV